MCTDISFWRQLASRAIDVILSKAAVFSYLILSQSLILSTGVTNALSSGVMVAFPSILNPALLSPNGTDIHATVDQTSWLTSVPGLFGMLGLFINYFLMRNCGRKITYLVVNLCSIVGYVMIASATNISTLIVARGIQGIDFGSNVLASVIICEYCHPKRRGYFIVIRKICASIGVLLCHALSLCWTWRQVAGLCIMFCALALITNLFWPESPSYLAVKGRFKECEASYKWFNGNLQNRKELDALISMQIKKLSKRTEKKNVVKEAIKKIIKKDFLNPFIISVLLCLVLECGGRHYLMVYAIKIMMSLVGEKSSAVYIVLGGDCLTSLATIISCVAVKHFKRRTLFFLFGFLFVALMFLFGLVLHIKSHYDILATVSWLAPSILILYSFTSSLVFPTVFILFGEIFPLENRELGSGFAGAAKVFIYFTFMKTIPISMLKLGLSGTFLLNGVISLTCFVTLYFILPETKDKTLLEIECEMRGEELTSDETTPLSTFKDKM